MSTPSLNLIDDLPEAGVRYVPCLTPEHRAVIDAIVHLEMEWQGHEGHERDASTDIHALQDLLDQDLYGKRHYFVLPLALAACLVDAVCFAKSSAELRPTGDAAARAFAQLEQQLKACIADRAIERQKEWKH